MWVACRKLTTPKPRHVNPVAIWYVQTEGQLLSSVVLCTPFFYLCGIKSYLHNSFRWNDEWALSEIIYTVCVSVSFTCGTLSSVSSKSAQMFNEKLNINCFKHEIIWLLPLMLYLQITVQVSVSGKWPQQDNMFMFDSVLLRNLNDTAIWDLIQEIESNI